jgi:hypothetical protein
VIIVGKYLEEKLSIILRGVMVLCLLLILTGCCQKPWQAFPMAAAPDRSCRTGTTHGYDVYIWDCYQKQKTVIYQYSAEMSCQSPQREIVACGKLTAIEKQLKSKIGKNCQPVPELQAWPKISKQ